MAANHQLMLSNNSQIHRRTVCKPHTVHTVILARKHTNACAGGQARMRTFGRACAHAQAGIPASERVFTRAVFVMDYKDSELFYLLEDTVRRQVRQG